MPLLTENLQSSAPRGRAVQLLFWLDMTVAFLLAGLAAMAPLLDSGWDHSDGWGRLVAIFARDSTVRQTAIAGSIGLAVTAWVFFRTPGTSRSLLPKGTSQPKPPSPTNVVG